MRPARAAATLGARLLVATCALLGCGSDPDPAPTASTLSRAQASRLAEIQVDNLTAGGASFVVSLRTATGDTVALTGAVDWTNHRGHAVVTASGAEADLAEIIWTDSMMLERRPLLSAELLDAENVAVDWIARAPSPAGRVIDKAVAIVAALAGSQVDNAVLIAQTPGSAYLGTVPLGGRTVEVLRFGQENRYSLDVETGDLVRFEQPPTPGKDAITVDVSELGPQAVELPDGSRVTDVAQFGDRYPFPQAG